MNSTPVAVSRIVRQMRGQSESQLVYGDDGHYYVAKLSGTLRGTRTLINDWIVSQLLKQMGICTPILRILHFPPSLISEEVSLHVPSGLIPPQGSVHLGSRCPVDPAKTVIWDFLPSMFLSTILNLSEFAAMLVFDTWVCHTAPRQAIFVPQRVLIGKPAFLAYFISHGTSFSGSRWELGEEQMHGFYFQRQLYDLVVGMQALVDKAVCRLESITETSLLATAESVPPAWLLPSDRAPLANLLGKLHGRQGKLRSIFASHFDALPL
jgi:hypothetical protein